MSNAYEAYKDDAIAHLNGKRGIKHLEEPRLCEYCHSFVEEDTLITCSRCNNDVCPECLAPHYPHPGNICKDCYDEYEAIMLENKFPH